MAPAFFRMFLIATALLLNGCATHKPIYLRPISEVPDFLQGSWGPKSYNGTPLTISRDGKMLSVSKGEKIFKIDLVATAPTPDGMYALGYITPAYDERNAWRKDRYLHFYKFSSLNERLHSYPTQVLTIMETGCSNSAPWDEQDLIKTDMFKFCNMTHSDNDNAEPILPISTSYSKRASPFFKHLPFRNIHGPAPCPDEPGYCPSSP